MSFHSRIGADAGGKRQPVEFQNGAICDQRPHIVVEVRREARARSYKEEGILESLLYVCV